MPPGMRLLQQQCDGGKWAGEAIDTVRWMYKMSGVKPQLAATETGRPISGQPVRGGRPISGWP